jgi:hypothetical protein
MIHRFARPALLVAVLGIFPAAIDAQVDNLTVHGYLSQGYASATDIPLYGISTDGTTDYRSMALQFRYAISSSNALVFQFSHRRLGSSMIQGTEPDVGLDWGFVQTRWEGTSIRVGKVPMPRGLFNEVRDVGTLFPFFRASKAFYSEGVETVDGVSASRSFDVGENGFSVDASAFYGEFSVKVEIATPTGLVVTNSRLYDAIGAHAQVNTPVPGLRLSGDYLHSRYSSGGTFALWTTSADMSQDRFFVRGEYEDVITKDDTGASDTGYIAYYAQGGFAITPELWVNGQYEFNSLKAYGILPSPPLPSPDFEFDNIEDWAFGLSYKFSPLLVLKGEYHVFEGYQLDEVTLPLNPSTGQPLPAGKTEYFIISLSAAF